MDWDEFISKVIDDYLSFEDDKWNPESSPFHWIRTQYGPIEVRFNPFAAYVIFHSPNEDFDCEFKEHFSSDILFHLLRKQNEPTFKELFTKIVNELKADYMNQFTHDVTHLKTKGFEAIGHGIFRLGKSEMRVKYLKSSDGKMNTRRKIVLSIGEMRYEFASYDELFTKPPFELYVLMNQENRDEVLYGLG